MIGIYVNAVAEKAEAVAQELCKKLRGLDVSYVRLGKDFDDNLSLIVVVGGDGTVLDIVSSAAAHNIPILAVNAGGTGFLSRFEGDETDECAAFIAEGNYETCERPLIECEIGEKKFYALNDFTVQRTAGTEGCTMTLSLEIDGVFADRFRGDGIIIATPTGSTAYSLSAGGAVLTPTLSALIATPLCAHTLRSKPIVFSDEVMAKITAEGRNGGGVFADGRYVATLMTGTAVTIKKSKIKAVFVKSNKSFYETLYRKLTFWSEK